LINWIEQRSRRFIAFNTTEMSHAELLSFLNNLLANSRTITLGIVVAAPR